MPDAPAVFYVGNVLPDLLSVSGDGRLRQRHVAQPAADIDADLMRGLRLHLATDQRFHGHPAFSAANAQAGDLLRSVPFETPLRRVFFLAHAFVEIALDGLLLHQSPGLVEDFYAPFSDCDLAAVVTEIGALTESAGPLLGLARVLEGFLEARYLQHYATGDGMASALSRVARRAGLSDLFASDTDRAILACCFDTYLPHLVAIGPELLTPPALSLWYNSGEFS